MNLTYSVVMHTYWHCGSGLAAGADVDALVVKDEHKLPFIPGKTIKGLLREAVEEIAAIENTPLLPTNIKETFGLEGTDTATTFFTNAELCIEEQRAIQDGQLAEYLYKSISSTAIDRNGVAQKHSLRKIETCVPCKLYGEIMNVPDTMVDTLIRATGFIKQLGQGRNRGLGRCTITITKEDKQ